MLHSIIGPSGPETTDLNGKIAVCTGGSTGIGFECSRWFARMGAHVAKEGSKGKAEWVQCDLGSLKQVKEVFTGIRERLDRLDIVSMDRFRYIRG